MLKKIDKRHYIYIALILASLCCCFSFHFGALVRLIQAIRDLATSVAYWCVWIVGIEPNFDSSINSFDLSIISNYTDLDLNEVLYKLETLPKALFVKEFFFSYLYQVLKALTVFSRFAILFSLPAFILIKVFKSILLSESNRVDNTKQLDYYLEKIRPKLQNFVKVIGRFIAFGKSVYLKILFVVWLVNLNLLTIAVSSVGFYFYFCATFFFGSFLIQIGKLLLDLIIMFSGAPGLFWLVALYYVFDIIRMEIGFRKLEKLEDLNKEVIDLLPLMSLLLGYMGAGKTTTMVDMTISLSQMLRDKSLGILQKVWLHFPDFPFWRLECEIDDLVRSGEINNMNQARKYVASKRRQFYKCPAQDKFFGYDYEKFKVKHDDGLTIQELYFVLEEYAQAYLIYSIATSIIISNLAIRDEGERIDKGHFPIWRFDYFRSPSVSKLSNMSHVVQYDQLRLGKRKNERSVGFSEFGIIVLSEFGKEVGNQNTNLRYKYDDENSNPKNDLLNLYIKLARHLSTVSFIPFIKILADEQRADSVAADYREVMELVHIRATNDERISMPFFTLTVAFNDFIVKRFLGFLTEYRGERDDRGLFVYFIHHAFALFANFVERRCNIFSYKVSTLQLENGSRDGEVIEYKYYLMSKKIYPMRFATDCNHAIFEDELDRCEVSILDMPTYKDITASQAEQEAQGSHAVEMMFKDRRKKM